MSASNRQYGLRAAHAFGHVPQSAEDIVERTARGELHADCAIARQIARGSQDQIAQPGQTGERLRPSAERHAKTRHFRKTTRDQRRTRIETEAEAIGNTRGNRQHVLYRAAHLHADDVVAGIDAHGAVMERRHRAFAARQRRARDRQRDRQALPDLARETRPRQHAVTAMPRQFSRNHLMRQQLRVGFETFAQPHHMRRHLARVVHRPEQTPQTGDRCCHDA
ncbi:hypothetical protein KCU90_g2363, partial [Aureobasidium melanogenum]